jgi:hypothetical protein
VFAATGPNFDLIYPQATIETVIGSLRYYSSGPQYFVNSGGSQPSDKVTYFCRLDAAAFQPCSGGTTLSGTSEGRHLLWVRTTYSNNGTTLRIADRVAVFIYDSTPPPAPTMEAPKSPTNVPYVDIDVQDEDEVQCKLDTQYQTIDWRQYCGMGYLEDGDYTLHVRLVDTARNLGPERQFVFTVDTVPPSPPANVLRQCGTAICADFFGTGPPFECSMDDAPYAACTSPMTLGEASVPFGSPLIGKHTFRVRVYDQAGNAATNASDYYVTGMTAVSNPLPPQPPTTGSGTPFSAPPVMPARLSVFAEQRRPGGAIRAGCRSYAAAITSCTVSAFDGRNRLIARGSTRASAMTAQLTLRLTSLGTRLLSRRGKRGLRVKIRASAATSASPLSAKADDLLLRMASRSLKTRR